MWQVVLLTGTSNFIQEIYQAFFLVNCTNLSELVRTGKMDFLMLLPVNTRFIVSHAAGGHPVFCQRRVCRVRDGVRGAQAGAASDGDAIRRVRGAVRGGAAGALLAHVHARLDQLLDRARAGDCLWLLQSVQHRADAGRGVSSGAFKAVFTFALPVLLVSNVPVRVLADKLSSPLMWLVLIGLGVIWAAISEWFWRKSLRRYTSAST